jgi:hypothetical protein
LLSFEKYNSYYISLALIDILLCSSLHFTYLGVSPWEIFKGYVLMRHGVTLIMLVNTISNTTDKTGICHYCAVFQLNPCFRNLSFRFYCLNGILIGFYNKTVGSCEFRILCQVSIVYVKNIKYKNFVGVV